MKRFNIIFIYTFRAKASGYPLYRENRENGKKKSVGESTGNLEILLKHGEFGLLKL